MAKVKIMKKELVWDIFCSADGSKIGTTKRYIYNYPFEEKLLKKMYPIISFYYEYSYDEFCKQISHFFTTVGINGIYKSIKEFYKDVLEEKDYMFYAVSHEEWNMIEVEADYFSIQEIDYTNESCFTVAEFKNYDFAVKYCQKNDVDINNIVPQKWGEYEHIID